MKPFLDLVRWVARFLIRMIFRLRIRGANHLPRSGPALIVSNHVSWMDPVLLVGASPRRIRFVIVDTFRGNPVFRFFIWLEESIPINKKKPRAAIEKAIQKLSEGELVCIFPEGGLTKDGSIREVKRGFELIVKGAQCPVVPAVITGLYGTALDVRRDWKVENLGSKPWPRVRVEFGEPLGEEDATTDRIEAWFRRMAGR